MDHPDTITVHVDHNVGKLEYADDPTGALFVTEFFTTVQGEAPYTGRPAVFLRLSGCNRGDKKSCPGCDTAFEVEDSVVYRHTDLIEAIIPLLNELHKPLLVITGGEPGIQKASLTQFLSMLDMASTKHTLVQFETNGDFDLTDILDEDYYSLVTAVVVSPKEPHKDSPWFIRNNAHRLKNLSLRRVVCGVKSSSYYHIPEYMREMRGYGSIFLSPQTVYLPDGSVNKEAYKVNLDRAIELSKEYGFPLSFQSHVFIGIR